MLENLRKLRKLVGRCFFSYVRNRCQTVVIGSYSSFNGDSYRCTSRVINRISTFNIFVNDIAFCFLNSKILLYADDMNILRKIKDVNDAHYLQDNLIRFQNYCIENKLDFNVSECFVIIYRRKFTEILYNYTFYNALLTRVDSIKDLGVTLTVNCRLISIIDNIVKKTSCSLGFVLRMSQFKSIKKDKILNCAYVRAFTMATILNTPSRHLGYFLHTHIIRGFCGILTSIHLS